MAYTGGVPARAAALGCLKGQRKIIIVPDEPGAERREYALWHPKPAAGLGTPPAARRARERAGGRPGAGRRTADGRAVQPARQTPGSPTRQPRWGGIAVLGEKALQAYLVNEIQEVYRLQGVNINDKHIETITRQMMRWVKVEDVGDTEFLIEEVVDKFRFMEENERVLQDGGRPATGRPVLLGITKASLSTESFISAASFRRGPQRGSRVGVAEETTRVLTEASISGKVDYLRGLKENVTMGRLAPRGGCRRGGPA